MIREVYPRAQEVILVRDFRDMVASILAYNAKRGYTAFGREHVDNDEEYIYECAQALYVCSKAGDNDQTKHICCVTKI